MSAAETSSVVLFVCREREEDYREIVYQVHSRREARHQNRQIGGQDTGKLLLLMGFGARPGIGMIQRRASVLNTEQVDACIMDVQEL